MTLTSEPSLAAPKPRRDRIIKIAASLFLAGCFLWIFRQGGIPLLPPDGSIQHLNWTFVPFQLLTLAIAIFLRTYRWRYLLAPLGDLSIRKIFGISLIGFAYIAFAPFRMGEFARPYMVSTESDITFTQATGTVAAERIIDGLLVSLLLLIGLLTSTPLQNLPDHLGKLPLPVAAIPGATYSALAVFTCAFIAMGLFYWARDLARRLTQTIVGLVSTKLADFLTDKVERVADGLQFLPSAKNSLPYLRDTVIYWMLCVLYTWFTLRSASVPATFSQAAVVFGVMGLGILIPAGPGFFGSFQLASFCGLAMFFPQDIVLHQGALYVFLAFSIQHLYNLLGLLLGLVLMRKTPAKNRAG